MEQTWHLKYRPQTIAGLDLVDVRKQLENILRSKKMPQAFLFSGPRGTGKTSSARIFAKAVNCLKPKDGEPCNKCDQCLGILNGSSLDVVEMDAASNRGIDDARSLKENIWLSPISGKYKVYIIDEVHMLTTEAANAMLKIIEEPPAHVLFMLCTTEPEKLPITVVSRCMQIKFRRPTQAEGVDSLRRVVAGEKLSVDEDALKLIAGAANGALRDGQKILEQVFLTQGNLSMEAVQKTLGWLDSADPRKLLKLIQEKEQALALKFVDDLMQNGVPIKSFVERTIGLLRDLLLADLTKKNEILELVNKMQWVYTQMRETAIEQLPLEIAIIELCPKTIEQKVHKVNLDSSLPAQNDKSKKSNLTELVAKWNEILKEVKPQNHSVEGLLRSTKPVEFNGETLKIEVFYKFHKDKLETEKCRQIVETAVAKIMQVPKIKLVLTLGKKKEGEVGGQVGEDIVAAAENIFGVQAV